ncbi:MAG: hypothetical protein ACI3XQ_08345 [Eubacteriales bacterium]
MKKLKITAVVMVVLMMLAIFPAYASEYTGEFDWSQGRISIKASGTYHIYSTEETTSNDINVTNAGEVTLVLDNVTSAGDTSRIIITNSDVTVMLVGTNSLSISDSTKVGGAIVIDGTSKLTIDGDGSLEAQGGAYWAAIGTKGDLQNDTAEIVINGGTINAKGGSNAAAIGAGRKTGVSVTVNGGNITATATTNGAGIGCGRGAYLETTNGYNCMTYVTINGGIVNATGGANSAGIGGSFKAIADITINGGIVNAYTPVRGDNMTGVCTWGINTEDYKGTLCITGGAVYSYNNYDKKAETLDAKYSPSDTESLVKRSVTLPDGAVGPYNLSVNGISEAYETLNADGKLNLYVKASDVFTAVLHGSEELVADVSSTDIEASDWKAFSSDAEYIGYQMSTDGSDARFAAALDNMENYGKVGFRFFISGDVTAVIEGSSTSLYAGLNECDAQGKVFSSVVASEYGADGLYAAKVKNLPQNGTYKVTVMAFAVTVSEETVWAPVFEYDIADGVISLCK